MIVAHQEQDLDKLEELSNLMGEEIKDLQEQVEELDEIQSGEHRALLFMSPSLLHG